MENINEPLPIADFLADYDNMMVGIDNHMLKSVEQWREQEIIVVPRGHGKQSAELTLERIAEATRKFGEACQKVYPMIVLVTRETMKLHPELMEQAQREGVELVVSEEMPNGIYVPEPDSRIIRKERKRVSGNQGKGERKRQSSVWRGQWRR